jgi:hypothetical protein
MTTTSEDLLIAALSSENEDLFKFAAQALCETHSQHLSLIPAILNRLERLGVQAGSSGIPTNVVSYAQWTAESVERLVTLLEQSEPVEENWDHLVVDRWASWAGALESLPPRLIVPHRNRVLGWEKSSHATFAKLSALADWLPRPPADVAAKLEHLCREGACGALSTDEFPDSLAEALTATLGESPEFTIPWVLKHIADPQPTVGDLTQFWLEPYLVTLTCQLRIGEAIPWLIERVLDPESGDFTLEALDEGLVAFGSEELVDRLIAAYRIDLEFEPTLTILRTLALAAGETGVRFVTGQLLQLAGDEEDVDCSAFVAGCLLSRISPESNTAVADCIAAHPDLLLSVEWEAVLDELQWSAKLAGQEFTQLPAWREAAAQYAEERKRQRDHDRQQFLAAERRREREAAALMDDYDAEPTIAPIVSGAKVGRNDPCPCGSGKKFKKCCLKDTVST